MSTNHLYPHADKQISSEADQHSSLPDEQRLWKGFKEGDMEAYAVIYRKYFFVLYQYGKKICDDHELIKDTIQDLFIKIWNNRENLSETTSIKYYLLTSFKRKLLDSLKSPQLRLASGNELPESGLCDIQEVMEEDMFERKEEVLNALNRLTEHQRKLLHLKFYKNLSNQEIAHEMGISIQSVYNAVFKTLRTLRKQLSIIIAAMLCYL